MKKQKGFMALTVIFWTILFGGAAVTVKHSADCAKAQGTAQACPK